MATYRPLPGGARSMLDISAVTQVSTGQGVIYGIEVITAPTAAGAVYDSASTSGNSASNQMAQIATSDIHVNLVGKPFFNGLVIDPGTDGVVAVYYDPGVAGPRLP